MENEETNNLENELKTEDGVFIDSVLDSLEVPDISNEEADANVESETIEIEQEGGL